MAIWQGNHILVRHVCGAIYWLAWSGEQCEFRAQSLIGNKRWLGDPVVVCECGKNILHFESKKWSEV